MALATAPVVDTDSDDIALCRQFRKARVSRGLSQEAMARRMTVSQPVISEIENCRYKLSERLRQGMRAEVSIAAEDGHLPWFGPWLQAERTATSLRSWDGPYFPGLGQIPDYVRHVLRTSNPGISAGELEQQVAARVKRQEIWEREDPPPPMFAAIISESALRQAVGDAAIMRGQLAHLLVLARRPGISVQVLPFSACDSAGSVAPFAVASFAPGPRADFAYLDDAVTGRTTGERGLVPRLSLIYDGLARDALRPKESLELIEGAVEVWNRQAA